MFEPVVQLQLLQFLFPVVRGAAIAEQQNDRSIRTCLAVQVLIAREFFIQLLTGCAQIGHAACVQIVPDHISNSNRAALRSDPRTTTAELHDGHFDFSIIVCCADLRQITSNGFFHCAVDAADFASAHTAGGIDHIKQRHDFSRGRCYVIQQRHFSSPFSFT